MPLPTEPKTTWPPRDAAEANKFYARWGAWYTGDLAGLARAYSGSLSYGGGVIDGDERRGGMTGQPRSFHGTPPGNGQLQPAKLHVPLAADIASTSADLLFGEPPAFVVADEAATRAKSRDAAAGKPSPAQQRLDMFMGEGGWHAVLLEGAEISSAYSGVYLRLSWDDAVADHVLLQAIRPDAAVPEFRSGRLVAVTFWRNLAPHGTDGHTWRHLERHEQGRIIHGLYASGDSGELGKRVPLDRHPQTEAFGKLAGISEQGVLDTGAPKRLTCEYVPNMKPSRLLRNSDLGRSDYDGIEPVMDSLDEAWSSWMRDLRLGKGRLVVPEVYLQSQGRGRGALFDAEQEIYETLDHMPGSNDGMALQIVQFDVRVEQHERTCDALTAQAIRGAGYSVQTFGESGDVAATATEVHARERRSFTTRARKINYWKPALRRLAETALMVDRAKFKTKAEPAVPDVEFPDGVATDPEALARTIALLDGAKAISTRTKVEMLHPDWSDERVAEEVEAIDKADAPPPGLAPPPPGSTITGPDAGNRADNPPAAPPPPAGPPRRPPATARPGNRAGRQPAGARR